MNSGAEVQRWQQIRAAFDELADLDATARSRRLAAINAADPDLGAEVTRLLAADADADARLERIERAFAFGAVHDDDPLKLVGSTVSHFRILEPLAAGGMGVVYRAEDTRLERTIALKFPLPSAHFDRATRERFLQEARSAGALEHRNICTIHEAGETADGMLFIAMPLYDGETLKARLAREGAQPVGEAVRIATQISDALAAAHARGIVHRDMKAANVMLLRDGTVKVLDFGLSKAGAGTLTATRDRIGTVAYMAPEQIQGCPVDARADLWALGVTLYEMLAGARPFERDYDVAIAHAIVHAEPPALSTLRAAVPPALQRVVATLLSKDPAARYASADDVGAALSAAVDNRVLRPRRGAPRRRLTKAVVAVCAVLGLAGIGGALFRLRTAEPDTPRRFVVLPFVDRTGTDESRYLGIGIGEAITRSLSRLHVARVPSYASVVQYRASRKSLPVIAREQGASAVVTGSVARVGDRVRVDVQVFNATTQKQQWSHQYHVVIGDVVEVQRDAARSIAAALKLEMSKDERARLAQLPTTSGLAYDLYLRGREVELRAAPADWWALSDAATGSAQALYARARDLDPEFALARAHLALTQMYAALKYDQTEARRDQALLEANAALYAQPGLGEAHEALAYYWGAGRKDMAKSIEQLKLAVAGVPNNADYHRTLGSTYRSVGRWEEAVLEYQRAMELEPRNPVPAADAAAAYSRLRRYPESIAAWDKAIALAPDNYAFRRIRGHVFLRWHGTADTLEAVLRSAPAAWDPNGLTTWGLYLSARIQRRPEVALAVLEASRHEVLFDAMQYWPRTLLRAQTYAAMGDQSRALVNYQLARALLSDSISARPRDARMRIALGLAYAGLGRGADAIREGKRAMDLVPLSSNHLTATAIMGGAAEVFIAAGETDAAFELLELLFGMASGREVSVPLLRVHPSFDPIRKDPRFEQLLTRYSAT